MNQPGAIMIDFKSFVLVLFISGFPIYFFSTNPQREKERESFVEISNKAEIYADVLQHLQYYEGLVLNEYECAAGHKTWGFGLRTDYNPLPDSINYKIARESLEKKFIKYYNRVQKDYPHSVYGFTRNQYLSFTLLIYRIGYSRFKNSSVLKECIANSDPTQEWVRWKYYTDPNTGSKIVNQRMLERCIFELNLYKGDFKYILEDERKFNIKKFLNRA